jgi:hypothetical protein
VPELSEGGAHRRACLSFLYLLRRDSAGIGARDGTAPAGKLAGLARKPLCMCRATVVVAASADPRTAISAGPWLRTSSAARIRAATRVMESEIPRWNRPASEWGQGSKARTTSRPSSESVHSALAGQWLQIWGLPR